jgi:hypothetical protein
MPGLYHAVCLIKHKKLEILDLFGKVVVLR